jgi:hypothetical protein
MITRTLDEIVRQVLNDPDVFYMYYTIFDNSEWKDLREKHSQKELAYVTDKIDQKLKMLKKKSSSQDSGGRNLKEAVMRTKALKDAVDSKPYTFERVLVTLDKFGLVKCNLPKMEDYGKVIENYGPTTVEQFFLYNIKRAGRYKESALRKILEYVKELYAMNYDILEIAFFVRKLNSLTEFYEIIKQ